MLLTVCIITALTIGVTIVASTYRGMSLQDFPAFTVLLVAAAASAGLRFRGNEDRVSFSFTSVVLLAAIPLVGPIGAVLLGIGAAVLDARQGWWQAWTFNGAMFGLAAAVASLVYGAVGGAFAENGELAVGGVPLADPDPASLAAAVAGPILLADIAFLLTNLLVLLVVTERDPAAPSRVRVLGAALRTSPLFLAWAVVASVVVGLWIPAGIGELAIILVIAPLVMTRHIHGLLSAERRVRASIIDALAHTGRDDQTTEHGSRVVDYATAIGVEMGLRPAERAVLQYTARLHWLGAAGPCSIEMRVGADSAEAGAAALVAHDVVGSIGFLAASARAIRHQAECFDGTGFPDGLAGLSIPRDARILAVACALDVVARSAGSSDPDGRALRAVRALAGMRFDPAVVDAFARTRNLGAGRYTDVPGEHGSAESVPQPATAPPRGSGSTSPRQPTAPVRIPRHGRVHR